MIKTALAAFLAAAAAAASTGPAPVQPPRFGVLVAQARLRVRELRASDLIAYRRQARRTIYVIDVREEAEWRLGRIPEARHLSKGLLEREIEKHAVDPDAVIVVYCESGSRSILAADSLQRMGYERVYSLKGGFRGWVSEGYPVVVD
jgi:rhodanese-related sulfurtransferase